MCVLLCDVMCGVMSSHEVSLWFVGVVNTEGQTNDKNVVLGVCGHLAVRVCRDSEMAFTQVFVILSSLVGVLVPSKNKSIWQMLQTGLLPKFLRSKLVVSLLEKPQHSVIYPESNCALLLKICDV